jgi:quinoprotein relay system zinc metallohydrolase 2
MHAVVRKHRMSRGHRAQRALRCWLAAFACGAGLVLSGAAARAESPVVPLPVKEIAAGVFVFHGETAEQDARNRGAISNLGFVVGSRCVAVIDTGGSPAVGEALLASVRSKTALPVCYVINTHVHPDHLLGNQAFRSDGTVFVGHAKLPAALAARGRTYIASAERLMGDAGKGLELVPPSRTVSADDTLDLGGRSLRLHAWPTAHTDSDLTVLDEASGTLFAGDLLFVDHMPVLDGKLTGWIKVSAALAALDVRQVVSGHGDAGSAWREAFARQGNYLQALYDQTKAAMRAGLTLAQAVDGVAPERMADWALADLYHRRNVTAAFAELEWEE